MIKQIYLVRGDDSETYEAFNNRIEIAVQRIIENKRVQHLSYTITEAPPPNISIIPFKKKKITAITLKMKEGKPLENMVLLKGFEGVYMVTEALPVAYEKTWADGEKTPGVCLLTLFKQKKSIDYKTFLDRWHNSHTPLSLKTHPLWHYNRNVVEEKLSSDSANWDGIVEEHLRTRAELLNPFKFFGNPLVIVQRMIQVYIDTKSFLDYNTIEPYLTKEYFIKS
ncbi:hypothetical protein KQH26_00680 [bacterium]|nr:hypothetical protein [bacterium]